MSSNPLTRDNGYQWPPSPTRALLTREVSDGVFGDIHTRLGALEDINDGIEALQAELQTFGVERLNEAINPLITDTQATLDQLTIDLNATIASLNADLAAAQTSIDTLLAGGVDAENINVAAIVDLTAEDAQAAFSEIVASLSTVTAFVAALSVKVSKTTAKQVYLGSL